MKDVIHLDDRVGLVLEDRDAVVRRPQAAALHAVHDHQRRGEQRDVGRRDEPPPVEDERQRRGRGDAEPDDRRELQPRDEREGGHAREAAQQIDHVGPQRRPAGQLAAHAVRHGDEQRGNGREEQRQQQRALDRHHRLRGAAREIDRGRARERDLEPQAVDRDDHRELNQREPGEQIAPAAGEQAADADAEKAREQDEVRKVRQQPDVRRHPPNQRGFEEEDEKRRNEQGHRAVHYG